MRENSETLEQFFRDVERRAYRMALLAVGDREEALDIVQEGMLRMVRRYATQPAEEWPPLFFRILQSLVRDWYRRQKIRNRWRIWFSSKSSDAEHDGDCLEQIAQSKDDSPVADLQQQQSIGIVDDALKQLPLRQQQAFMLRAWEELSVKETAFAMGCSEGSVKSHYSRAVHTLRERLEGKL